MWIFKKIIKRRISAKINKKNNWWWNGKNLSNLEELREVCKFVTEIGTGEDNKKFDKIILEDKSHYLMHLNHKNFNFHNLSLKTIENFV